MSNITNNTENGDAAVDVVASQQQEIVELDKINILHIARYASVVHSQTSFVMWIFFFEES